ncbi:MgtC family protein [Klebsiella pneumoniae]
MLSGGADRRGTTVAATYGRFTHQCPGGHRRGGVYSQRDVGLAGQPGRIAAQIVSGIGFLGAGVIMRDGMNVRGLNTAATLWCSAGIGVLCGLGQFWNATAATLIILCANILLREAAQRIHALPGAGDEEKRYVLRVTCLREHENAVRQLLLNIAQQQRFTLQGLQSAAADTADHLEICAQLISHKQHQKTLAQIMAQMGVQQNVTSVHWRVGEA